MKHILLVDDHEVVRIGLKKVLGDAFPINECGEANSSREALSLAGSKGWDLVILELSIDDNRGLELLKEIKRTVPQVQY